MAAFVALRCCRRLSHRSTAPARRFRPRSRPPPTSLQHDITIARVARHSLFPRCLEARFRPRLSGPRAWRRGLIRVLRQHDRYTERDEVAALSDAAFRLDQCARHWAAGNHTDGLISLDRARRLVRRFRTAQVDELVTRGVWRPAKPGYFLLVDHNKWNETRAEYMARVAQNQANAQQRWHPRDGPPDDADRIASRNANRNASGTANGTASRNANRNASRNANRNATQ